MGVRGRSVRACRMRVRLWPPRLPARTNQRALSTTASTGSGTYDAEEEAVPVARPAIVQRLLNKL